MMLMITAGVSYTVGTFIWTVIGVFVAGLAAIFAFLAWRVEHNERQDRLRRGKVEERHLQELAAKRAQLFTIEHQPTPNDHLNRYESTELGLHHLHLTTRMELDTQVLFVALRFNGEGKKPRIITLDDWQFSKGERPPNVYPPYELPAQDHTWYWQYKSPHPRLEESRITVGLEFQAETPFLGSLSVRITTVLDGAKEHELPIRIGS